MSVLNAVWRSALNTSAGFFAASFSFRINPDQTLLITCAHYSYPENHIAATQPSLFKIHKKRHTATHSQSSTLWAEGGTMRPPMGLRTAGWGAGRWQRGYPITEIKAVDWWWIMNINWMLFVGIAVRGCGEWENELMRSCWRDEAIVGCVYTHLR